MIRVSEEFKSVMDDRRDFIARANVTLADGSTINLEHGDFTVDGNSIYDGAEALALPLGEAIGRTIQIEIVNDADKYVNVDFFGAKINLYIDFRLSATTESIFVGRFTVLTPETYGDTIIISATDDMYKADKPYASKITYPTTLAAIFREACEECDIAYLTSDFAHSNYVVQAPLTSDYTFRQVFGYIAMIAGGNAKIDRNGYMDIITYRFAEGDWDADHVLSDWRIGGLRTDTNSIMISGIQTTVSVEDENGEYSDVTTLIGEEGYVLTIENPLIIDDIEGALNMIATVLVGKSFRKFEGEHIAYPLAEFMDTVVLVDRKGNQYTSVITDISFIFFGYTTLANRAESSLINDRVYSGSGTKAIIEAKKLVEKEKTNREFAVQQLALKLATASGLHQTPLTQADGSTIWMLHDKPTLNASTIVIKVTAAAIGFSTDGGATYPFGITVDGETIMRIIQTEGLNADWIKTGALTVTDPDGNIILDVNVTNKTVTIGGWTVNADGLTATSEDGYAIELNPKKGFIKIGTLAFSAGENYDATISSANPIWISVNGKSVMRIADYGVQFYGEIYPNQGGELADYIMESNGTTTADGWFCEKYASGKVTCWGDIEVTFPAPTLYGGMLYRSIAQIDMSNFMSGIIDGACPTQILGKIPQVCRNGTNRHIAEIVILTPLSFESFTATIPLRITGMRALG